MDQCENVAQFGLFVVHQNVGIGGIASRRKGARTLSSVFVFVDPSAEQSAAKDGNIFVAERLQRTANLINRLVEGVVHFNLSD